MATQTFHANFPVQGVSDVAANGADVTLDDANDIAFVAKLYIGTGGDVKVTMLGGQAIIFKAVPAGTFMPILVKRVWSTGTTASNIRALW